MSKTTETLGDRLKWAREKRDLQQADVYKKVGIQQSSYSELETGKTRRSRYTVELARVLDVDSHWLATGEGDPFANRRAVMTDDYEALSPARKKMVDSLIALLAAEQSEDDQLQP